MKDSNALFSTLTKSYGKYFYESFIDEKNEKHKAVLGLLTAAILAYAGVQASNVLFRNNFGSKGVNMGGLILSCVVFLGIAIGATYGYSDYSEGSTVYGSQNSFAGTAVFYFVLIPYLLFKAIKSKQNRTAIHPNYRGDSFVFSFLMEGGWSQAKVQNFAEPIFLIAVGVFLLPINLLLGIPLILCAISVWITLVTEIVLGVGEIRDDLSEKGYEHSQSVVEVVN